MRKQFCVRTIIETTWEHIVEAEDQAGACREAQRQITEWFDRFGHQPPQLQLKSRIMGMWLPAPKRGRLYEPKEDG